MTMASRDFYIIVAAGSGSRFGAAMPKQFCNLGSRPLLMTTIERISAADPAAEIILVLSQDMIGPWRRMCAEAGFSLDGIMIAPGGATRHESVRNALSLVPADTDRWISVHDGARPVVTTALIDRIKAARKQGVDGIIPAVAVTDSLRIMNPDGSSRAVDRSLFRAVQTPQSFPARLLLDAYSRAQGEGFTDDASVMEAAGYRHLTLVDGDTANIKVTNPGDMETAASALGL